MSVIQEISVPRETVNDEFVIVAKTHFSTGDQVRAGDALIDIETSKIVFTMESEAAGFIEYLCSEGQKVPVGECIIMIHDSKPEKSVAEPQPGTDQKKAEGQPLFSKAALALMAEHDVDSAVFAGTDMVSAADVRRHLGLEAETAPPAQAPPAPTDLDPDKVEMRPLSAAKKLEIEYLRHVQSAGLNSVVNVFVDTDNILRFIGGAMDYFTDSLLPVLVYETARLLRRHPHFNACFAGDAVAVYNDVNVGLAVDIDDGLKVLTVPGADNKDLNTIEKEIYELINKYMDRELGVEHVTGATFTITDLSAEGVSFFTPLINRSQSAVMGVSGIDAATGRMTLTLTFDHRVTEGKQATRFLCELKEILESYRPAGAGKGPLSHVTCAKCLKTLEEDRNMKGKGFVKVLNHDGEEIYLCRICLEGY